MIILSFAHTITMPKSKAAKAKKKVKKTAQKGKYDKYTVDQLKTMAKKSGKTVSKDGKPKNRRSLIATLSKK